MNRILSPFGRRQIEERLDVFLEPALSSRRTASGPANTLANCERPQQDFALRWVEITARTNAEMAYQFVVNVPAALQLMDETGVEAWLIHAMDVYDSRGLHSGIAALNDVEQFARHASDRLRGAVFEDVASILELFVHGLGGRRLKLDTADTVYTDTQTIYLPAVITHYPQRDDNFSLYKAMAVQQWAQCWFGSWRENIGQRLSRYDDPVMAQELFHALETRRLNAGIERSLPGQYRQMQRLCEIQGEQLLPAGWPELIRPLRRANASVNDTLQLLSSLYGKTPVPARLCFQGHLQPQLVQQVMAERMDREKQQFRLVLTKLAGEQRQRAETSQSDIATDPVFNINKRDNPDSPGSFQVELEMDGQSVPPSVQVKSTLMSIFQDLGKIPDDYLVPAGDGAYEMFPGNPASADDDSLDVWKGTYHERGAHLYNEWDFKRQHYRKNWCVLRELTVHPKAPEFVAETLHRYAGLVKEIRRTFESLRGEDKRLKKQPYGDDVDIDALVEAWADASVGLEMTEQLFTKMHKQERNIAVMFMVDMSGSTRGWINDAERESLILLCEALEILGDRYAIYGFSGMTRKRCELYKVKGFDERYNEDIKGRISGIAPQDYTRMGVTIRHLSKLLNEIDARTRLLITLSDGKPDDYDGYRGEYGIEDTRMALIEAKREGIHPFCITIDKEGHDYLPHMYGAVNYTLVDDVKKLPLKVSDIYRRLTT
ncbi:MAG: hypothetical protein BMS9Abin26_0840 [Gammaproteobacteria bacterium]|nr:MAG: hypothetical protein BMS9Abin26_0840 [Gammaproteobacteria bacterium]